MLGLDVHGRGHTGNWSQLPPVPCLGQVSKRHKAPQDLLTPAGCTQCSVIERALGGTQFGWWRISGSHECGACGVYQVNAHWDLALVLSLRLLSKSLRVHWGQFPPTWQMKTFSVGYGIIRVELVKVIRLIQIHIWLHGWRAQHKDNGGHQSSHLHKATQLNFSLYISGTLQAVIPPPEPKVDACEWKFVPDLFKGKPGFPPAFYLTQMDGILTDFTARWYVDSSSNTCVQAWEAQHGAETLSPQGGPLQLRCLSRFSTSMWCCGASCFHISTSLTNLYMASFVYS